MNSRGDWRNKSNLCNRGVVIYEWCCKTNEGSLTYTN